MVGMLLHSVAAVAIDYSCEARPEILGPCFEFRGRLSFWNGSPSARIWPVGSARMLGVHNDELPIGLRSAGFDTEIWGTFRVCPFTKQTPGRMQFVCIESWRDVTYRHRRSTRGYVYSEKVT